MSTPPPPRGPGAPGPPAPPAPQPSEQDAAWQRLQRDFEQEVHHAVRLYLDTMSNRALTRQRRRQALVKAMTPGGAVSRPAAAPQPAAPPQQAAPAQPLSEAQQALVELKRDFPAVLLLAIRAQPERAAHLLKELLEIAARADAQQVAQIQQRLVVNLGRLSQLGAVQK